MQCKQRISPIKNHNNNHNVWGLYSLITTNKTTTAAAAAQRRRVILNAMQITQKQRVRRILSTIINSFIKLHN